MKRYYRIILGLKVFTTEECFKGNFIGANFGIDSDLTNNLPDNLRDFNQKLIPAFLTIF